MLINPQKNAKYRLFLNQLFDDLDFLINDLKESHKRLKEFKWAISLNYLLLNILGENLLSQFLKRKHGEEFDNYKVVSLFELKTIIIRKKIKRESIKKTRDIVSFFHNQKLNPPIFSANLYKMRKNLDLKMLFSLFGGENVSENRFNKDGTGGISFEYEDLFNDRKVSLEKKKFIKEHLESVSKTGTNCIAINKAYHWIPLHSIKWSLWKIFIIIR